MTAALAKGDIRHLFALLDEELRQAGTVGEIFLVGGAAMCVAYDARPSTGDVDAIFRPAGQVRAAAARVAAKAGIDPQWLNEGVKGFMSAAGEFAPFPELDHLRVMAAQPQYLLAMKCLAMRIGADFNDEEDVRFVLRLLEVRTYDQALDMSTQYYPLQRFPQKSLYALKELLPKRSA